MDVSSVFNLCRYLITSAIQRCRASDDVCRLSVFLKLSPLSDPPLARISISDTGIGSSLEEFQGLKFLGDPFLAETWDGVISIATTSICDNDIYHHILNLKESVPTRRLKKLPSRAKNGARFSGTEVLLSTSQAVDNLLAEIRCFLQKMLILKMPKVAIELGVDHGDSPGLRCENIIQTIQSVSKCPTKNIGHLESGLKEYVLKHGNRLDNFCSSCFSSRECLKVGSGVEYSAESSRNIVQVVEAVIIISELFLESMSPSCIRLHSTKTEVLYFKDFVPCSISQSSLNALTSIDWKSYGLNLQSISDKNGEALLEWENLPPNIHIDIVLHHYRKQVVIPPTKQKAQVDRTLTRKAVKSALDDLKEKNAGVLLTAQALKIRSYAPDLARSIAGLILSSSDSNFQEECISLLGLQSDQMENGSVENCIREKLISVINLNDRKPNRSKEAGAPYLFEDDCFQEPNLEENEEGEEFFSDLDE